MKITLAALLFQALPRVMKFTADRVGSKKFRRFADKVMTLVVEAEYKFAPGGGPEDNPTSAQKRTYVLDKLKSDEDAEDIDPEERCQIVDLLGSCVNHGVNDTFDVCMLSVLEAAQGAGLNFAASVVATQLGYAGPPQPPTVVEQKGPSVPTLVSGTTGEVLSK
jgi:hypothetical protein